jgi:hypothetical protein
MQKDTTKKSIFSLLLKVTLFIVIVAGTILAINYFTDKNTRNTVDDLLGLDPNATTEKEQEVEENSKGIAIPGFEKLVFQSNNLTQEVSFENPEQNEVYFIISLFIDDESVYESQLIEPGKGIYSIEIPTSYAAGEYTGKLSYETRSMSNSNEKKNGAIINFPIIFE